MSINKLFIESLEEFVGDNSITLYHYSNENVEKLKITPDKFGENPWSKREKRASSYPRSFFYVNIEDTERYFKGKTLYKIILDKDAIYDLKKDPMGFITDIRKENGGALNMDVLLETIHGSGFMGAYYEVGIKVVILFVPVTASRINVEPKYFKNMNEGMIKDVLDTKYVAIISGERGDRTEEQNTNETHSLRNDLIQTDFSFTKAEGGFIENMGGKDEREVIEKSFMVWDENEDSLKYITTSLAKRYNQENILWKTPDDPMAYFLTPNGVEKKAGVYIPNKMGQYFTRINNFVFVFE